MVTKLPEIIWIDCEMTGLSLEKDYLVEIAVIVTDSELQVQGEGFTCVIKAPDKSLHEMDAVVTAMHTNSGLLGEIPSGVTLEEAETQILLHLNTLGVQPGKSPLAGNSVSVDRGFIARDLPNLNAFLHYRTIDVTSIKELARRWYPKEYFSAPQKSGNHRAMGDILDSIAELIYYREKIFTKLD